MIHGSVATDQAKFRIKSKKDQGGKMGKGNEKKDGTNNQEFRETIRATIEAEVMSSARSRLFISYFQVNIERSQISEAIGTEKFGSELKIATDDGIDHDIGDIIPMRYDVGDRFEAHRDDPSAKSYTTSSAVFFENIENIQLEVCGFKDREEAAEWLRKEYISVSQSLAKTERPSIDELAEEIRTHGLLAMIPIVGEIIRDSREKTVGYSNA